MPPLAGPNLPTVGTFSYNEFTFPNAINTKVAVENVYNTAGAGRKYLKVTIRVEFIIVSRSYADSGSPTADDQLETIRALLSEPGQALIFTDKGLGDDIRVNTGSTSDYIDITYGPKPEVLVWEPLVEARAARVVWQCHANIVPCGLFLGSNQSRRLDHAWSISWTITDTGATQRVIKGRVEYGATIGGVIAGTSVIPSIKADADRTPFPQGFIDPLPGFRREQEYSLSEDRRYWNYTIVDTEIESDNPFQPYMVDMDGDHTASSTLVGGDSLESGAGFRKWPCEIDMRITLAPKAPRALAWVAFLTVIKDRLAKAPAATSYPQEGDNSSVHLVYVKRIITGISIRESLYSREFFFNVRYVVWCSPDQFFQSTGLFEALPGNWVEWKVSMDENVHHEYGNAKLDNDADPFTLQGDVCLGAPAESETGQTPDLQTYQLEADFSNLFSDTKPDPKDSWLDYDNQFEVLEITNSAHHYRQTGGEPSLIKDQNIAPDPQQSDGFTIHGGQQYSQDPDKEVITQVRGPSIYLIRMHGKATRQGHRIPMPTLVSFGGQPVERLPRSRWTHKQITKGSVPIYRAVWNQYYIAKNIIGGDLTTNMVTSGIPAAYR